MLIALLLGYLFLGRSHVGNPWFLGGRSTHQMSEDVARLETDKDKRKEVDHTLGLIEKDYKNLESERSKLEKDTLKALENHDTSAEQFHALRSGRMQSTPARTKPYSTFASR
jgi:hypothetical protein